MNQIIFKGTCTAIVTPFTKEGIDYKSFEKQLDYQISNGVDAICVLGTTGESPTISEKEFKKITKFTYDKIEGRVKFILGTGSNCTKTAIYKSQYAEKNGADGLLVITPYYNKCTQKGLIKYYNDICSNIDIPIIAYNIPSRTGVNILPDTMKIIALNKKISGIKEASGNIHQIRELFAKLNERIAIYSGDDNLNLELLFLGSMGVISVASNILPKEVSEVAKLFFLGKIKESKILFNKIKKLIKILFCEVNPIPVKKAIELIGLGSSFVRPPLTELEEEHTYEIRKILNELSFKFGKEIKC